MNNTIVKIEKSGNRFNAWDADGVNTHLILEQVPEKELMKLIWL